MTNMSYKKAPSIKKQKPDKIEYIFHVSSEQKKILEEIFKFKEEFNKQIDNDR